MQFTENVEKIVHFILVNQKFSQIDVCRRFKISRGYVCRIVNYFIGCGFVERLHKNQFRTVEPARLANLWAVHRRVLPRVACVSPPVSDLGEVEDWLVENYPGCVLCMFSAWSRRRGKRMGNKVQAYLPEEGINVIVNRLDFDQKGRLSLFVSDGLESFGAQRNVCSRYLNFVDLYARGYMKSLELLMKIRVEEG